MSQEEIWKWGNRKLVERKARHAALSSVSQFPFGAPNYFGLKGQVAPLCSLKYLPPRLVLGFFSAPVKNGTLVFPDVV